MPYRALILVRTLARRMLHVGMFSGRLGGGGAWNVQSVDNGGMDALLALAELNFFGQGGKSSFFLFSF